jgi:hypothetical protein
MELAASCRGEVGRKRLRHPRLEARDLRWTHFIQEAVWEAGSTVFVSFRMTLHLRN